MSAGDVFFDSNVLLYLMSAGEKPARARALLDRGGVVSVQVLNEFASVARGKIKLDWAEIREILRTVQIACKVEPISLAIHERGLAIAERFGFQIYDSMIVAAALVAGCTTLLSEDMQHGQRIERMTIRNPFLASDRPEGF
jgi:predicted nucleic acid-binding protein